MHYLPRWQTATATPTRVLGGAPKTRQEDAACFVQELEKFVAQTGSFPRQSKRPDRSAENAMAKKLEKLDLSTFPALERRVTRLREGAGELLQRELHECFVQELEKFVEQTGSFPCRSTRCDVKAKATRVTNRPGGSD